MTPGPVKRREPGPLREVAAVFLKLGVIGFGGPAAHIALMRDEVVRRRRWLAEQQFLDLLGASALIPGPSSTELGMFLGYARAGRRGLLLAGACFITPAMLMVLALAWAYVRYGTTPAAAAVLYGVKPVIIGVIAQALWGLAGSAVKNGLLGVVGAAVLGLYLLGANPILLLFGGALLVMAVEAGRRRALSARPTAILLPAGGAKLAASHSLLTLFLTFLKIGAVTYGSGYVLLAFLHDDFVGHLGWLTNRQLIDAVAVGQVTPGPVFTTATFIGYLVAGWPGALLATLGIFLPSFLLAALVYPLVPRLRASPWLRGFLDGANVAALGLMAAVTWQLAHAAIIDALTAVMAIATLLILIRWKPNSAWLIAGGIVAGVAHQLITG
ncbi:MAG TPA: chromate efflux transporter [Chloroflexota bacterium]|nr:chromate efflux transporter [Chloroflexota bacterium]